MDVGHALVAGGAGFLGSHLCDRLLAEGWRVSAVDNLVTGDLANIAHLEANPRFAFLRHDIVLPLPLEGPVNLVLNLASPASPVDYLQLPIETLMVGSAGAQNMLDLARAKGARFVQASTSEVYGDPSVHPQPEEYWGHVNPIGTRSCYDESKRYAEAITFAYRRKHGLDTGIVRIFNTYGPRMRVDDGRVVPAFLSQAIKGEPLTVFGTGLQTRSFCYVSDLIDGIYRMAVSDQPGPINIGNPAERTMIEFAHEILRATGSASEIIYLPQPTEDDPKQRRPDIAKAKKLLGWAPQVDLAEGIGKTIDYFRQKLGVAA